MSPGEDDSAECFLPAATEASGNLGKSLGNLIKSLGKTPGRRLPSGSAVAIVVASEPPNATRPHTDIAFYGIVPAGRFAPCQQSIVPMKLTRLRLHGFKSFVEPTDFVIEAGLTGVVGPNGCGKSNLVEALRWAMGETS